MSIITVLLILYYYFWEFTKDTMYRRIWAPEDREEEDVNDRIVIVTGANTGIGKAVSLKFAKRGARVVLACRNLVQGKMALEEIQSKSGSRKMVLMHLDLASLDSVREFAGEVRQKFPAVHVLVNNAGVSSDQRKLRKTSDGFEMHMGTNHLGHFLLTNLLLDNLKRGAPSRVVVVSSTCQLLSDLDLDDLMLEQRLNPTQNFLISSLPYNNSKFANSLFAKELGARLEGTGVTTYSLCPGIVKTDVWRDYTAFGNICAMVAITFNGVTTKQSCETILYCALSKKCSHETGKMYRYSETFWSANRRLNNDLAKRLWKISEDLVQLWKHEALLKKELCNGKMTEYA